MITNIVVVMPILVLLFASLYGNNASPAATTRMTVSKMRMADLESSANGYAYNQQGVLPASYMIYTNHGSGRYYRAPAAVHYIVGSTAPVASIVPDTTYSPHESILHPYATATRRDITPHTTTRVPYLRDGFINYSIRMEQLAKYAQQLPKMFAPSTSNGFESSTISADIDKRSDEMEIKSSSRNNESHRDTEDDDKDKNKDDETEVSDSYDIEKADDLKAIHFIENQNEESIRNLHPNIDVQFEVENGVKYSNEQNLVHDRKNDKGYSNKEKFNEAEREQYDKSQQKEHYDVKTRNEKDDTNVTGDYGHYDEGREDEKGSSYGQTSYHKKGQKTRGFHKVYHKDEYKKSTDFYDESHNRGSFDKYFVTDEHHNATKGDFEKAKHRESGFDYGNSGKAGYYDQSYKKDRDQGYNKDKGENSFYKNYENYDSDHDEHLIKNHGHKEVHDQRQ